MHDFWRNPHHKSQNEHHDPCYVDCLSSVGKQMKKKIAIVREFVLSIRCWFSLTLSCTFIGLLFPFTMKVCFSVLCLNIHKSYVYFQSPMGNLKIVCNVRVKHQPIFTWKACNKLLVWQCFVCWNNIFPKEWFFSKSMKTYPLVHAEIHETCNNHRSLRSHASDHLQCTILGK